MRVSVTSRVVTPVSLAIRIKSTESLKFQQKTKIVNSQRPLIATNSNAFSTHPGHKQVLGILWLFHDPLPRLVCAENNSQQKVVSAA
jgi:hypothetical protein